MCRHVADRMLSVLNSVVRSFIRQRAQSRPDEGSSLVDRSNGFAVFDVGGDGFGDGSVPQDE
jgi:hypothetical protein